MRKANDKDDFGNPGDIETSIEQWNSLRPARSIALQKKARWSVEWNRGAGLIDNGSQIFQRSINHFCPHRLVLEGTISDNQHGL